MQKFEKIFGIDKESLKEEVLKQLLKVHISFTESVDKLSYNFNSNFNTDEIAKFITDEIIENNKRYHSFKIKKYTVPQSVNILLIELHFYDN